MLDGVKNFPAAEVQTDCVRLPSFIGAHQRGGKGGRRAQALVLVWTSAAGKFSHQQQHGDEVSDVFKTHSRLRRFCVGGILCLWGWFNTTSLSCI